MKWPWQHRKQATLEREEAEASAEKVHREVTRPLREMRLKNHLTDAVLADIQRNLKESGS